LKRGEKGGREFAASDAAEVKKNYQTITKKKEINNSFALLMAKGKKGEKEEVRRKSVSRCQYSGTTTMMRKERGGKQKKEDLKKRNTPARALT